MHGFFLSLALCITSTKNTVVDMFLEKACCLLPCSAVDVTVGCHYTVPCSMRTAMHERARVVCVCAMLTRPQVHLSTHDSINKNTAKASLQQMLSVVFSRMEAKDAELKEASPVKYPTVEIYASKYDGGERPSVESKHYDIVRTQAQKRFMDQLDRPLRMLVVWNAVLSRTKQAGFSDTLFSCKRSCCSDARHRKLACFLHVYTRQFFRFGLRKTGGGSSGRARVVAPVGPVKLPEAAPAHPRGGAAAGADA